MHSENLAALPSGHTFYVRQTTKTSTSKGPEAVQLPWSEGHSQTFVANLGFRQTCSMPRCAIHRTLLLALLPCTVARSSSRCNRWKIASKKQWAQGRPVREPLWQDLSQGTAQRARTSPGCIWCRQRSCRKGKSMVVSTHESKRETRQNGNQQLSDATVQTAMFGRPCSSRRTQWAERGERDSNRFG